MSLEIGNKNNNTPKPEPKVAPQPQPVAPQPVKQEQVVEPVVKTQPQQQSSINPKPQGNNMNHISSRINYGTGRSATSEVLSALILAVDKINGAESTNKPIKFSYHSIDREMYGLNVSALVVVAAPRDPSADQKYVAHHTLLLGATSIADSKTEQTIGKGIRFERVTVTGDAYDSTMRARVTEIVSSTYPGFQLIDADATDVPAWLDMKSEHAVRNIIANATTASSVVLSSVIANDAWVISPETIKGATFKSEVKSSWDHFTDLTGKPIRADVIVEMSKLESRTNRDTVEGEFNFNNAQSRSLITQTTAFIDVVSTPPDINNGTMYSGPQGTNPADLKCFTPRLVITNIDSPEYAGELPLIIQSLGTLQALQNNSLWKAVLLKQFKDGAAHQFGGINIRDLSVLGLEVPVVLPYGYQGEMPRPTRIAPINSNAINDTAVMSAINTYFNDTLLISMDVEICGPSSWSLGVFVAAARGDQNAIRDIIEATDLLTGGKFTPIYKAACKGQMLNPVLNDDLYINLGQYDSAWGKRDNRDCDYLTVSNINSDASLEKINDWANLQANVAVDSMLRLAEQRKIQSETFESMTTTGRAARVTLNPAYIFAVAAAVAEAGLIYETELGIAQPQSTSRMIAPYMRSLPTGLGNAGGFVTNGMSRANTRTNTASSFGAYASRQANANNTAGNF